MEWIESKRRGCFAGEWQEERVWERVERSFGKTDIVEYVCREWKVGFCDSVQMKRDIERS